MAKTSEWIGLRVLVNFCEINPGGAREDTEESSSESPWKEQNYQRNLYDKYVYVFSSTDSLEYGIDEQNPGWLSRTHSSLGFQHAALMTPTATPAKPSHAPKPTRLEREIYIDHEGLLWDLDLHSDWDKPRHERPHPKWGKKTPKNTDEIVRRVEEFAQEGKEGQPYVEIDLPHPDENPKRYYFFLSPFQLGPKALKAAQERYAPDGLSLWYSRATAEKERKLVAVTADDLQHACNTVTIPLVDPYQFGDHLRRLAENACFAFFENPHRILHKNVPGLDPRHFDEKSNQGTIEDLHLLATALSLLMSDSETASRMEKHLDLETIREVLLAQELSLRAQQNSCDLLARHLANWLVSPAHRILDVTVTQDFEDGKDGAAGDHKGAALAQWYQYLRFLPMLGCGVAFLAHILSDDPDGHPSPVRDVLFRKYESADCPLDDASTDARAFELLSLVLPDLVLLHVYRIQPECCRAGKLDPEKADEKLGLLVNILDNLKYFDVRGSHELAMMPRTPQTTSQQLVGFWKYDKYLFQELAYVAGDMRTKYHEPKRIDPSGKETPRLEVNKRGMIADRWLKMHLPKSTLGFANEQLARLGQEDSVGKRLAAMTQEWDRLKVAYAEEAARAETAAGLPPESLPAQRHWSQNVDAERLRLQARLAELEKQVKTAEGDVAKLEAKVAEKGILKAQKSLADARNKLDNLARQQRWALIDYAASVKQEADLLQTAEAEAAAAQRGVKNFYSSYKVFLAFAGAAVDAAFLLSAYRDPNAGMSRTVWAGLDFAKSLADVVKESLKRFGVSDPDYRVFWKEAAGKYKIPVSEFLPPAKITSPEWRARFRTYTSTLWQQNPKMFLVGLFGTIGGAYNLAKYGSTAADAFTRDDYTVFGGGAVASLASILGCYAAMGGTLMLGATLIPATFLGSIASAIVAAGVIVLSFTTDTEWETFAKHCYFAKPSQYPNQRPKGILSSAMAKTWWGVLEHPERREKIGSNYRWGVRSQRTALERLLSRFSVSSRIVPSRWPTLASDAPEISVGDFPDTMEMSGLVVVQIPHLPPGASIRIALLNVSDRSASLPPWRSFEVSENRIGHERRERIGQDWLITHLRYRQAGSIACILKETPLPSFQKLTAKVTLTFSDHTTLWANHDLVHCRVQRRNPVDSSRMWLWFEPNEEEDFANTYEGASDPFYTGGVI